MKRILLSATAVVLSLSVARAETVWVGNAFIDAVSGSATCTSIFIAGDHGRLVFRPRGGALGNSGDSQLVYLSSRSAFQMVVAGGDFQAGANYAGQSEGSTGTIGTNAGGITSWSQSPSSIGAGTDTIDVTAKITNFFRINPCLVTLRTKLIQR